MSYITFERNVTMPNATKMFGGFVKVGQTFTPSTSHICNLVSVMLIRKGESYDCGPVTLKLCSLTEGIPSSVLASKTVEQDDLPIETPEYVDFEFSSGVRLASGTMYVITLETEDSIDYFETIGWRYNQSGTYTSGSPIYTSHISLATGFERHYYTVVGETIYYITTSSGGDPGGGGLCYKIPYTGFSADIGIGSSMENRTYGDIIGFYQQNVGLIRYSWQDTLGKYWTLPAGANIDVGLYNRPSTKPSVPRLGATIYYQNGRKSIVDKMMASYGYSQVDAVALSLYTPSGDDYEFTGLPMTWSIKPPYHDPPEIETKESTGWGDNIDDVYRNSTKFGHGTWEEMGPDEWVTGDYGAYPGSDPLGFETLYYTTSVATPLNDLYLINKMWAEHTDGDFIFMEKGSLINLGGAQIIQLYPRFNGSYTQLKACSNGEYSDIPNWQCVNDEVDAPNEQTDYVAYNLFDTEGFMSGEPYAAGRLTGTYARWRTGYDVNGLWGKDTAFTSELEVGQLLKPATNNEWYKYNNRRIAEIKSIEDDEGLTFTQMQSGTAGGKPSEVWFYTPRMYSDADNAGMFAPDGGGPAGLQVVPKKELTGYWLWEAGSKRIYSPNNTGNAINELVPHALASWSMNAYGSQVKFVESKDAFWIYDPLDITRESNKPADNPPKPGGYCSYHIDDDLTKEETQTMWTTKTKKDSYVLKTTQADGNIERVDVVFRCGLTDSQRMTTGMIATYDSSDEDKGKSFAVVKDGEWGSSEETVLKGTLVNGTGVITESPVNLIWDKDSEARHTDYDLTVTQEGTFTLTVLPKYKILVKYAYDGAALVSPPDWTRFEEGEHTIVVSGTGKLYIVVLEDEYQYYTNEAIGVATSALIENAMAAHNYVVFAPGTWRTRYAALCYEQPQHISTNYKITDSDYRRGAIQPEDCTGSHDELVWQDRIATYREVYLYANADPGYILEDYVTAGRNIPTLPDSTATAQPFIRLNAVESYGDEETVYCPQPTGTFVEYPEYQFTTYRQTISKPGGGRWTKEDINSMEVGIVLGNVTNPMRIGSDYYVAGYESENVVMCTQIYAEVFVVPIGYREANTIGFTQYGFKTFENGMDEWCFPVFNNGMNMLAHKVYSNSLTKFFAEGIQRIRVATSKLLRRGRTSGIMGRGRTSGHSTH